MNDKTFPVALDASAGVSAADGTNGERATPLRGATEREHLLSLPPLQRRFLKGYQCGLCDQRLDRDCASIYGPKCSDEKIIERRKRCIEQEYRPRKSGAERRAERPATADATETTTTGAPNGKR